MPKSQSETFDEIEKAQARTAATLEQSKQLLTRSQQLLDCHKKKAAADAQTA